jgi:CheY-like chemotaxis protein
MNPENTVLLVEDNSKDVLLFRRALRKADVAMPLQVVDNGEAAIQYLAGEGIYTDRSLYPLPSLVLLDLKLPRRSGAEVLAWIRQHPALKRLPVVMLTSSRQSTDVNQLYDLGANAYLAKPQTFDELVEIVKTINQHWITYNEKPEFAAE